MATYLKHKPTGDIYIATSLLMARTDMIELTAKEAGYFTGAQKRKENAAKAKTKPKAKAVQEPAKEDTADSPASVNSDVVDDIVKTAKKTAK